jgi:hypothetical protein
MNVKGASEEEDLDRLLISPNDTLEREYPYCFNPTSSGALTRINFEKDPFSFPDTSLIY